MSFFHLGLRPELRLMWALEAIVGRMAKRYLVISPDAREFINKQVEKQWYYFLEEEIYLPPIGGRTLVETIESAISYEMDKFIRINYDWKSRKPKTELAFQYFDKINKTHDLLLSLTEEKYKEIKDELGSEWSEMMWFDYMNITHDNLGAGVCAVLLKFPEYLSTLSEKFIERFRILGEIGVVPHAKEICDIFNVTLLRNYEQRFIEKKRREFFDPNTNQYEFSL